MAILNNRRWKYVALLPLMILILSAVFFMYAGREIENALLHTKFNDMVVFVESLNTAAEANQGRSASDHEAYIHKAIEHLDRQPQLFAAVYQLADDELTIVTERWYETSPLDPLARAEFREAIAGNEYGTLVMSDTPEGQQHRENLVYFRWMPPHTPDGSRSLMVVAVSYLCIDSTPMLWVAIGQWASIAVTFALNVWLVILLVRLG